MKRGFSLVEVLVSLSIIAVLLALLQPVFRSAKRSAIYTEMVSLLRQQHLAISLYRADWGSQEIYGTPIELGLPPTVAPLVPDYADEAVLNIREGSNTKIYEQWQVWPCFQLSNHYQASMPDWLKLQHSLEAATPLMALTGFQDSEPLVPTMIAHIRWIGFDGGIHARRAPGFRSQIAWFFDDQQPNRG